jgi:hypothetical protein
MVTLTEPSLVLARCWPNGLVCSPSFILTSWSEGWLLTPHLDDKEAALPESAPWIPELDLYTVRR